MPGAHYACFVAPVIQLCSAGRGFLLPSPRQSLPAGASVKTHTERAGTVVEPLPVAKQEHPAWSASAFPCNCQPGRFVTKIATEQKETIHAIRYCKMVRLLP